MRSTNIDINDLMDALEGKRDIKKPVGYAKSVHGQFMVAFVATHPDDHKDRRLRGKPVWTEDGKRAKLNWRVSNRQSG